MVTCITPCPILSQGQVSCALDASTINFPGVVNIRIGNDQTDFSETSVVIGRNDSACSQCSSDNITLSDSGDGVCLSLNVSPLTSCVCHKMGDDAVIPLCFRCVLCCPGLPSVLSCLLTVY